MFPIGPYPKAQVRELAAEFDLPTQKRKDSQGICFLGKLRFEDFVGRAPPPARAKCFDWIPSCLDLFSSCLDLLSSCLDLDSELCGLVSEP
mmetsp:Transcript_46990/g.110664  ORF Transcript_46990/g.110664 Transcript_46990/m.110664 type:complete len:91 (-) Transcript_46990:477-749(-)